MYRSTNKGRQYSGSITRVLLYIVAVSPNRYTERDARRVLPVQYQSSMDTTETVSSTSSPDSSSPEYTENVRPDDHTVKPHQSHYQQVRAFWRLIELADLLNRRCLLHFHGLIWLALVFLQDLNLLRTGKRIQIDDWQRRNIFLRSLALSVDNHQFRSYLFGTWKNLTDARDIETSYKK